MRFCWHRSSGARHRDGRTRVLGSCEIVPERLLRLGLVNVGAPQAPRSRFSDSVVDSRGSAVFAFSSSAILRCSSRRRLRLGDRRHWVPLQRIEAVLSSHSAFPASAVMTPRVMFLQRVGILSERVDVDVGHGQSGHVAVAMFMVLERGGSGLRALLSEAFSFRRL